MSYQTSEGAKLQLSSSSDSTHAIVVSTLMEAHAVVKSGLVADRTVNDVRDLVDIMPFMCHDNVLARYCTDCPYP